MCNKLLTAFPRQKWFPERSSLLRYTYIVSFLKCVFTFKLKKEKQRMQRSVRCGKVTLPFVVGRSVVSTT
jgi:hypothetical protein